MNEYGNPITYGLKWLYLLLIVFMLLSPVFYVMYISFNEYGFGARQYVFTLDWYKVIFTDRQMMTALGWTMKLAVATMVITIPLSLLAAKYYKSTRHKVVTVFLLLSPLFVSSDIMGSALLVFFKNLSQFFTAAGERFQIEWLQGWFELGFTTALIGLIIYTMPYAFIVILITMGRYHQQQTEAARACGASAWRAFVDVEFPQIRAGVFSACAFTIILAFNEYTRTNLLKGGFDTFTTVLISQMLNTGMSEQSYAMSSLVSFIAIAIIGTVIIVTMIKSSALAERNRVKAEPGANQL